MSTAYDIIENQRPAFFAATTLADSMIRMSFADQDEFVTAMYTAANCLDDLRRAYADDLERMNAIMEQLRDRRSIEGL